MKRQLSILAAIGLTAVASINTVACNKKQTKKFKYLASTLEVNNWLVANFLGRQINVNKDMKLYEANNFNFFWKNLSNVFDSLEKEIGADEFSTFKEYMKINMYMTFEPYELTWKYDQIKNKTFASLKNDENVWRIFLSFDPHEETEYFNKNISGQIRSFRIELKII